MVNNELAVCPVCGRGIWLRMQYGFYLNTLPLRVNCKNCRALIRGTIDPSGIHIFNAETATPDVDEKAKTVKNASYIAEMSGELPCKKVRNNSINIVGNTPYLESTSYMEPDQIQMLHERLDEFVPSMNKWNHKTSIAFNLLDEGSFDYIGAALDNMLGDYSYSCDNEIKALQCLQEVVLKNTHYLFIDPNQDDVVTEIIKILSQIDKEQIHEFVNRLGGTNRLVAAYRKTISVFSSFMDIYPNLLPAETYLRYKDANSDNFGISTCSFSDIKTFYQDSYETILSLLYIPVCLDNIISRGQYNIFSPSIIGIFQTDRYKRMSHYSDYKKYIVLEKGMKLKQYDPTEPIQSLLAMSLNGSLRNGIGHNSFSYDGVSQTITVFDRRDPTKVELQTSLLNMATDCISIVRDAVVLSEIILFLLREQYRQEGKCSVMHPRFYQGVERNEKCPCGSQIKYKSCCKNDIDQLLHK